MTRHEVELATVPAWPSRSALFVVAVLAGGAWMGAAVWAAGFRAPASGVPAAHADVPSIIALGGLLALSLAVHAWYVWAIAAARPVVPLLLLAAVWAGLVADGNVDPFDATAVLTSTSAVVVLARRPFAAAPIGIVTGLTLGLSPLMAGAAAGLCIALRGHAVRLFALGMILGLGAMTALGVWSGRPPWLAVGPADILTRVGPAAAWRYLAQILDIVMPVLVLGTLGLIVSVLPETPRANVPPVARAIRIWFFFNVVVAIALPAVSTGHAIVLLVPAGLWTAAGWGSLRGLVSRPTPTTTALCRGACMFLLAVLLWTPLRIAGECILVALAPR